MTTKTTGAEIKRFYADPEFWPEDGGDTWHEEELITIDGTPIDTEKGIAEIREPVAVPASVSFDAREWALYCSTCRWRPWTASRQLRCKQKWACLGQGRMASRSGSLKIAPPRKPGNHCEQIH